MVFGLPASIEIFVIGLLLAGVSKFIQNRFVDKKAMAAQQKTMKEQQKRLSELSKENSPAATQEMERIQASMMENLNKMMGSNMRVMVASMVIFFPALWVLSALYSGQLVELPFALPVFHRDFSFEITATVSWLWVYIYSSLIGSILIGAVMKAFEKQQENTV